MDSFSLTCTDHTGVFGRSVVTWRSPRLKPDKLDYVLVPRQVANSFSTMGTLRNPAHLTSEWDHELLLTCLHFQREPETKPKTVNIDPQALKLPENADKLSAIFNEIASVPWWVNVESHSSWLHQQLVRKLEIHFPKTRDRPRKECLPGEVILGCGCSSAALRGRRSRAPFPDPPHRLGDQPFLRSRMAVRKFRHLLDCARCLARRLRSPWRWQIVCLQCSRSLSRLPKFTCPARGRQRLLSQRGTARMTV